MKKFILILILLTGFNFLVKAQSEQTVYKEALSQSLPKSEYILLDSYSIIEDDLGFKVFSLSDLIIKFKTEKKKLRVFKIFPIRLERGIALVSVFHYNYIYRNKTSFFELEGGTYIKFKYNCDKNIYEFLSTTSWGV